MRAQRPLRPGLAIPAVFAILAVTVAVMLSLTGSAPWASGQGAKRVVVTGLAGDGATGGSPPPSATTSSPSPTSTTATATQSTTSTPTRTATPTATSSPTPTATPTPTVAGSPTATAPGGCTSVIPRKSSMYRESDSVFVVGEVVNNCPSDIEFVVLEVDLLNASGQVLATVEAFPDVVVFPAGGDSPFFAYFDPTENDLTGAVSFRVRVISFDDPATFSPVTGLIIALSPGFLDEDGSYVVSGTVKNNSGTTYLLVQPILALYDASGNVIRTDFTFIEEEELAPGQTAQFEFFFFFDGPPSVAATRAWVEAIPVE